MTSTGFDEERAATHESRIEDLHAVLAVRGYRPRKLQPDGNRPDMAITDKDGRAALVDLKTATQPNYAIKLGSLNEFWRIQLVERTNVYIVWGDGNVDTVHTLAPRIVGGPRRRSGAGSQTDWVLVRRGGTPFDEFFVPL